MSGELSRVVRKPVNAKIRLKVHQRITFCIKLFIFHCLCFALFAIIQLTHKAKQY